MHLCVFTAMGDENDVFTYVENGLRFLFPLTFVKMFLNVFVWFPTVSVRFLWIRCRAQGLGDPRGFASSRSGFAGFLIVFIGFTRFFVRHTASVTQEASLPAP